VDYREAHGGNEIGFGANSRIGLINSIGTRFYPAFFGWFEAV
jgi:hypothetical protein